LRRIASILRGRPDEPDACVAALLAVIEVIRTNAAGN
jgi:hypothetical protein